MEETEWIRNTIMEVRRGVIVLAVMSQLEQEQYGYSLLKLLADHNMEVDQGTLYPLLRRLESQGLLQSAWRIADEARPRRYYALNEKGRHALEALKKEWDGTVTAMNAMLEPSARKRRMK